MFVCKQGGQSEFILRVKQGDNPTFGFLMPDHHLHAYFRFLVDHEELLQTEERKANNEENKSDAVGGALSLLGSVYGSGEDEDGAIDENPESIQNVSGEKVKTVSSVVSQGSGRTESNTGAGEKEHPLPSQKVKTSVIKKNPSVNSFRAGSASTMRKDDVSSSFSSAVEKLKESTVGAISRVEPLVVEPPSDIKKTIDKIVDFIAKNGKQFEATLVEQDSKHGRFPFLLPSNLYHPFYLKVLQKAQESKLSGRSFLSGKKDSTGLVAEKKASLSRENDSLSLASTGSDMPFESDRKEKFKMVISKTKKDGQDANSKENPQDFGITVDAASAAAILQAASRGIKNPDLGIISSTFFNDQSGEGGQGSKSDNMGERIASIHVAGEAAGEADSEAHLTKEQKLKAERLKKAKMFVATLKGGAAPSITDKIRGSSVEPQASAGLRSGSDVTLCGIDRERSSAPPAVDISDKNEEPDRILFNDEYNEKRSKRTYRSRSGKHDDEDEVEEEVREQKPSRKKHRSSREDEDGGKDHRHSKRRKHRSSRSSLSDKEDDENDVEKDRKRCRRKHRSRHASTEDDDSKGEDESESYHKSSRKKHQSRHSSEEDNIDKEDDESESYHKSSRKKRSSHRSLREEGDNEYNDKERDRKSSRKKHRSRSSSRRSRHDHKHKKRHSSRDKESEQECNHDKSSDDEYLHRSKHVEHHKETSLEELEEGEIGSKLADQSRESGGGLVSREASLVIASSHHNAPSQPSEAADVSDDLRAKIRAMLMATR